MIKVAYFLEFLIFIFILNHGSQIRTFLMLVEEIHFLKLILSNSFLKNPYKHMETLCYENNFLY